MGNEWCGHALQVACCVLRVGEVGNARPHPGPLPEERESVVTLLVKVLIAVSIAAPQPNMEGRTVNSENPLRRRLQSRQSKVLKLWLYSPSPRGEGRGEGGHYYFQTCFASFIQLPKERVAMPSLSSSIGFRNRQRRREADDIPMFTFRQQNEAAMQHFLDRAQRGNASPASVRANKVPPRPSSPAREWKFQIVDWQLSAFNSRNKYSQLRAAFRQI